MHLEKVFKKALEYGISLNPKKCVFKVKEGKLVGHIVSKDVIRIDLERVATIDKIMCNQRMLKVSSHSLVKSIS